MAGQNLLLVKGFGAFVLAATELTPDTTVGSPYNAAVGDIDFRSRPADQQHMLYGTNHATSPQQAAGTTVAFIYSDYV